MALTNKLSAIGNAIRKTTGKTALLTLDQMPKEIIGYTIPAEYTELTYIQSSGLSHIDSGVLPVNNCSCDIEFELTGIYENASYSALVSCADHRYLTHFRHTSGTKYHIETGWVNTFYSSNQYINTGEKQHLICSIGIYNNTDSSTYPYVRHCEALNIDTMKVQESYYRNLAEKDADPPNTLGIFARNNGSNSWSYHTGAKLYKLKLWADGELVRWFVPCKRNADNVLGLYDVVNNQFYTNSGSGSFTGGDAVN